MPAMPAADLASRTGLNYSTVGYAQASSSAASTSPPQNTQSGRRRVVGAPSPQQVRRRSVETLAPIQGSPVRSPVRRVKLAPSATLSPGSSTSPVRRRVAGAPKFRKRTSAFAAAATVLHGDIEQAERTTEEKMNQFRKEMDNMPTTPTSPKGKKWGRVKNRVQWVEGSSCAICMTGALTGRLKPCGHRSMCEACYEEVYSEGRGVYCPSCFQEAKLLKSDSISSSDNSSASSADGRYSDEEDGEENWNMGRRRLTNSNQASLHLLASRAGTKLDNPNICATSAVEIAQAFGTGTGTMFLHMGLLLMAMFMLACLQIPTLAGNSAGIRTKNNDREQPNIFVRTTLGNCGQSSCSIDGKWYIVISDAAAMILLGLFTLWIRANVVVFQHQVHDKILSDARRTLLVVGCDANVKESQLKRYFKKIGTAGLEKVDVLTEVEAMELALMQRRRVIALRLRVANAKIEWGDPTSTCSGECISEEEWGHMMAPKLERKLVRVEKLLSSLEDRQSSTLNAFVWFNTAKDRNAASKKLLKLSSVRSCNDLGTENGSDYMWNIFERCIGCSTAARSVRLAGTSKGDGLSDARCTTHPALFPANLVHRNMTITSGQRLLWRLSSIVLLVVAMGICTAIYAATIRTSRFLTAILLLLVNSTVPHVVALLVRQQRAYLRTEESDVICFLSFLVVAFNVLYFTLYSAFYSSRDGGLAKWEHMFTLEWYQRGGGDVLHYYVMLDAILSPILLAMRTGNQRMRRQAKLRKAVCQEQLNQVHVGIELDYLCEYSMALVCPAMAIVLCCGLPMLPWLAGAGLLIKYFALKHVLFYESAVPLWRDGTLVKWGGWVMQLAVLAHFLFASAMLVSANQVDFETSDSIQQYAVGLYAIHPLAFIGVAFCMGGAKCIAPCISSIVLKRTTRITTREDANIPSYDPSDKMPSGKTQRAAIERVRQEREQKAEEDAAKMLNDGGESSSSEDSDDTGDDNYADDYDLTATETYNSVLKQLDKQSERAWGVDLVVNPAEIKSFDAGQHPYFGAEIQLRRSMRQSLIRESLPDSPLPSTTKVSAREGKSKIHEKIEKRRIMRTGKKAAEAAQNIKNTLNNYVERAKRKKARRLQETVNTEKRQPRQRARAGNHIV